MILIGTFTFRTLLNILYECNITALRLENKKARSLRAPLNIEYLHILHCPRFLSLLCSSAHPTGS